MAVTVYSTSTCPYCDLAKQYLQGNNVNFNDINVAQDQKAAQEMIKKSGQMGVPVIDFNGEIIVGFNRKRLSQLIVN